MKKYMLTFLSLIFLNNIAFAGAVVPLWGITTSSFVGICMNSEFIHPINISLAVIYFIFVVLIETLVVRFLLKNIKFLRIFYITCFANFISTIAGVVLLYLPLLFIHKCGEVCFKAGPWSFGGLISWILYHILCFYLSYIIEYNVAKKWLLPNFELLKIKKSFLWANIISCSLIPIYLILFILFMMARYDLLLQ